ncbi:MAG: energy transducer TonB [Syntrophaceae bacterium]|nr:energy transducer TonB [Deltaproteobacteria bacterium]
MDHDLGLRLYASQVLKIIQANLSYPANARRRNLEGKLSIRFSVDEQGKVSDIEIISSSGIPLLDKASVKTIQSCVFPPPPDKATILTVPVTFKLVENS